MSNIIDGIDHGMGYEPTKEWGPNIQWWSDTVKEWIPSSSLCQTHVDNEIRYGGRYRRALPIISQHQGAIPLEPGEELTEAGWYLMRDGVPFPLDNLNLWEKSGKSKVSPELDIIARLPQGGAEGA